jgi:hypothetical protein
MLWMNGCISLVGKAGKTVHNCLNPAGKKQFSALTEEGHGEKQVLPQGRDP